MASPVAFLPLGLPAACFPALLELLPSGVVYYTPVANAAGVVVDLRFAYFNASAQRLLALPAHPTATYRQHWPASEASGAFAFHCAALRGEIPVSRPEADGHLLLHARSVEGGLLVSFTDLGEQPAPAAAAVARAAGQPPRELLPTAPLLLRNVLEQVPALVVVLHGPEHRFAFFNTSYQETVAGRGELGHTVADLFPELASQGYLALLDQVYASGQPFGAREQPMHLYPVAGGPATTLQLDYYYQPLRDAEGQVTGILIFGLDVTEKVETRRRVQQLNEELRASNEELVCWSRPST